MSLDSAWVALERRAPPLSPPPHAIHPHNAIAQTPPKPTTVASKSKLTAPKPTSIVNPTEVSPSSSSSASLSPISSISSISSISTHLDSSSSDPTTTAASTHPSDAESATGGPVTPAPSNIGLIAGITAGAVVVVLVIGGLVLRSRRRRNRAARDAEEYQQRAMMNKYSERNGSSINSADYGMDGFGSSATLSRVMGKQPDWFAQKPPLEYYQQVPPLTELHKHTPQPSPQHKPYLKHETSVTSAKSSASTSSYPGYTLKSSSQTELIQLTPTAHSPKVLPSPLKPYQQQQYQQPRVSTNLRSPTSPTSPTYLGLSPTNNRPQQQQQQLSQQHILFNPTATSPISPLPPALPPNSLYTYHPPPPTSPVSPLTPSQPSAGFYDFLLDAEDVKGNNNISKSKHSKSSSGTSTTSKSTGSPSTTPPPVPRATRPVSVISTSSLKLKASGELKSDASAPAVPALPKSS